MSRGKSKKFSAVNGYQELVTEKNILSCNTFFSLREEMLHNPVNTPRCRSISQLTADEFHLLPIWLLNIQADKFAKNKCWWGLWNNPLLCSWPWNFGQFSLWPVHASLYDAMVLAVLCWLLWAFSLTFVLLWILLEPESDVTVKWCNLLC